MAKQKTNRTILTKLIKELDDMDLVMLRERILTVTQAVIENEAEVRKDMQHGFISPDMYIDSMKKIHALVDFGVEPNNYL
jgi:uncharacterized protein (DUF885 family)